MVCNLARRVAAELHAAGWRLERILSDNGGEFRSAQFRATVSQLGARHTLIRAGRPSCFRKNIKNRSRFHW